MSELIYKCGDCLNLMKDLPDKSVDMILCDLPYGITQNPLDKRIPFKPLWEQYRRIIKDNGCIALFCQGKFYIDLVNSQPKLFKYDLIWDKVLTSGFLNAKKMPLRRHEQIAIFYKKPPVYNPQFTQGKPLHSKGTSYVLKNPTNNNYGEFRSTGDERKGSTEKYPTSIIRVSKSHPSVSKHRTEKPIALLEWLIKTYTNKGMLILDNCAGSGGTGIAAMNTGRNFMGMELDKETYQYSINLIEDAIEKSERIVTSAEFIVGTSHKIKVED